MHTSLTKAQAKTRIWAIAWPMTLSSVSMPLLGLVDTALLGHLDAAHYLGAVAIGANFIGLMYWSFGFLRMGTTGLIAQAFGRRWQSSDKESFKEEINAVLFRALAIGVVLGGAVLIVTPLISSQVVSWMQASENSAPLAKEYIDIRRYSAPAVFMTFAISGWLVGSQQPRRALALVVTTNAINIVLDILFIVYLDWQSAGAAWATLIAEHLGLALGLYFLASHSNVFDTTRWRKWLAPALIKNMLAVNYYLLIRTLILMLVFNFFTAQGAAFGDSTLAANAILLQLFLFSVFVMDGFSYAAEALCGEAYGARNATRFKQYIKLCGIRELQTALAFGLFFAALGAPTIAQFTDVTAVLDIAHTHRWWIIVLPLAGCLAYLFDGVSIGAGKTRAMLYSILIATFAVFFPIWFTTKEPWGNNGLWLAFLCFNLARGLYLWWFWRKEKLPESR